MAFFMEEMTVREMESALTKTKTVVIPVGLPEQHGFHLPLGTDILNAVIPPRIAGDRLNAVVAPSVNYCFSGGELMGTINVSPNAFGIYMSEICSEFIRLGFKNVVILLGHGGSENTDALKSTLQTLLRRDKEKTGDVAIAMMDVQELSETGMKAVEEHDYHAGLIETSNMLYWRPDMVRDEIVLDEPQIAENLRTDPDWYALHKKVVDNPFVIEHVNQREEIKVGVMGYPEKATRSLGEKVSGEIVNSLVALVDSLEKRLVK
ncbi:MAG: creatininase family protein [Oscillospiraceae bacterium]|nr:creatininase family protein [Oscillospiraceae bacterium]